MKKIAFTKESFEARERVSESDQVEKYQDVIELEVDKRDRKLRCCLMQEEVKVIKLKKISRCDRIGG